MEVTRDRRAFESYEVQPHPGQTVVLTIDQTIQFRTEQALFAAVERARAKSGTAIVMDPHTGEILALANAPAFDPNQPGKDAPEVRANWALQNIYEPGSTFKVVAYSAAIEKGLVTPEDKINCQMGEITVAGRLIHDHKPFGVLTVSDALAQSSNVGAIKLALLAGNESMYDYTKRLGFGSRTGIDLAGRITRNSAAADSLAAVIDRIDCDGTGNWRHAAADGRRVFGDREWRQLGQAARGARIALARRVGPVSSASPKRDRP